MSIAHDAWVLVENQLERTDHGHLSQLLTYASGLSAAPIVWITARFTEEHRSTLDWLNKMTDESFRFFGPEVELWRIGDSPAVPKFNVVSKPNDWSRSVAQAARAIDESELSKTRVAQRAYWGTFHQVLDEASGKVSGNRKAQAQSWMSYLIGRSSFNLGAGMIRPKKQVRAELYMKTDEAKAFFHVLRDQKDAIEQELGYPLEWEELPARRDWRIAVYLNNADPEDEKDWRRQHDWLAMKLNDRQRVFSDRVRLLDTDEWQAGQESDISPLVSKGI